MYTPFERLPFVARLQEVVGKITKKLPKPQKFRHFFSFSDKIERFYTHFITTAYLFTLQKTKDKKDKFSRNTFV